MLKINPLNTLYILVLIFISCSKNETVNPNTESKTNNCVMLSDEIYPYDEDKFSTKTIHTYDTFKNLVKTEIITNFGAIMDSKSIKNELNSENKPIKAIKSDFRGIIISTTLFEYYPSSTLKNRIIYYPDEKSLSFEKFQYNENGTLTNYLKTSGGDSRGIVITASYNSEGLLLKEEETSGKTIIRTVENTYDTKNRLTKSTTSGIYSNYFIETFYGNSDRIIRTKTNLGYISEFIYSRNLLVEIKDTYKGNKIGGIKNLYGGNARIVKIYQSFDGTNYPIKEERKYQPNGKIKQRMIYSLKGNSRAETYLGLEASYDSYGNETKIIRYSADGSHTGKTLRKYSCGEF